MHLDPLVAIAGLGVGFVVGLTGMGGGALMTPILVLVFKVPPLAAVSSDLVAAVVMKPVGGTVHLRRGTVHLALVRWLCLGSVPAAFLGVVVLKSLGSGAVLQDRVQLVLGAALLLAATGIVAKGLVQRGRAPAGRVHDIVVRPGRTLAIGAIGGLVVGMTSVGSGSLMIVLLLVLYPSLSASQLVGTDLVQAIPLVASAALGHLLFGDFELVLTGSLLVGSLPGVYLGRGHRRGRRTTSSDRPWSACWCSRRSSCCVRLTRWSPLRWSLVWSRSPARPYAVGAQRLIR